MRLTSKIKETILRRVKADTFDKKEEKLKALRKEFTERLYVHLTKDLPKNHGVPIKYLRKYSNVLVINDRAFDQYEFGEPRALAENRVTLEKGPLLTEWKKLRKMKDDNEEGWKKLKSKLNAMMDSVTTRKRLAEVWPEGEEAGYIPKESTNTLPAICVADINKEIEEAKG